jgi:hypothetical protein
VSRGGEISRRRLLGTAVAAGAASALPSPASAQAATRRRRTKRVDVVVVGAGLAGGPFGTTGIALAADHATLLVGQQSESGGGAGNPATGRLWSIPIAADGAPGAMRQLWESRPLDGPDSFGLARSGNVYIALVRRDAVTTCARAGR